MLRASKPAGEARALPRPPRRRTSVAPALDLQPIEPVIARVVERMEPEEIWLFGSRAEGRARPDSDYDLLVVLPDSVPDEALDLALAWELTCGLGVAADVVPCTRSEFEEEKEAVGTLASAAFRRGRRVYARLEASRGRVALHDRA
jgi:predicted nucleotidyltransferase